MVKCFLAWTVKYETDVNVIEGGENYLKLDTKDAFNTLEHSKTGESVKNTFLNIAFCE